MIGALLINIFAIRALNMGRHTRRKLISGLIAMYRDNGVESYYDASLLESYTARYRMFVAVLAILASIAILVPLVERLMG
jgi:hypothetical protein